MTSLGCRVVPSLYPSLAWALSSDHQVDGTACHAGQIRAAALELSNGAGSAVRWATPGLQALGVPGSRCGAMVLTRAPERGTSFHSAARRAVSLAVDLVDELLGDVADLGVARGGGTPQESERTVFVH